jgi:hypothetical protein
MAKEKMLCPFSGKLCKECPLYRGRHYYLCFNKSYRGHLENPGETAEMPSAVDPSLRPMADIRD